MKKFSVIFLIIFLILCTALIKNSTKKLDEEIFVKKENIRSLKNEYENIKLEYDYLSSTEKLFEFQNESIPCAQCRQCLIIRKEHIWTTYKS